MCNNDGGRGNFVLYYNLLAILMISHTLVMQVWSNLDTDVKKNQITTYLQLKTASKRDRL